MIHFWMIGEWNSLQLIMTERKLSWVHFLPVDLIPLQGAGHNDVELYNQYLERLKTFVSTELTN